MKPKILIIDDELGMCTLLALALRKRYAVRYATDAEHGLGMLAQENADVVLLDLVIGETNGIDVLRKIKAQGKRNAVIMMTAFGSIKSSVEAIKHGAFTYLTKPLDLEELSVFIDQALEIKALGDTVDYLSDELKSQFRIEGMIGDSEQMRQVYSLVEKLKDVDSSVIVSGESGTGKELVARAIHFSGKRGDKRFVVINCAAIPEALLEEELFGHKRGSFTGAVQDRKGKFEVADKGTVFLDEIGDMPLGLQSKLLRILQQKEFTPLGDNESRKVDVRIIAATNQNLERMVRQGDFREDLFYRLNVMNITMPSLRERPVDIPLLCQHFIKQFGREQNKPVYGMSASAQCLLGAYDFPGNVRQLANIIEHAMILCCRETIDVQDLPDTIRRNMGDGETACCAAASDDAVSAAPGVDESGLPAEGFVVAANQLKHADDQLLYQRLATMTLKDIERLAIQATLRKQGGRRDRTAEDLGISVRSLLNKINEYGL